MPREGEQAAGEVLARGVEVPARGRQGHGQRRSPSNLDPCLNLRALENVGEVVSVLEKQRDKGDTADDCGMRGECTENDDPFRCGD